ncbi:hypothetical protein [Paenibacillus sp. USDA918EY]|uniref:hypothetical protein n=1 Tax=Paenibacillus sp. USDA918EY TaxID=2689575 RepID=UPI001F2EE4EE|nr:hypothetical protein [Paenibacillus sp. USDA918EY]
MIKQKDTFMQNKFVFPTKWPPLEKQQAVPAFPDQEYNESVMIPLDEGEQP